MRFSDDHLVQIQILRHEPTGALRKQKSVVQTLARLADGRESVTTREVIRELRDRGVTTEEMDDTEIYVQLRFGASQHAHTIRNVWPASAGYGERIRINGYHRLEDTAEKPPMEQAWRWESGRVRTVTDEVVDPTDPFVIYHAHQEEVLFSAESAIEAFQDRELAAFDRIGTIQALSLAHAFELSQHGVEASPWHAGEYATLEADTDPNQVRSTSVGDLIYDRRREQWWVVASVGFSKIDMPLEPA